jgi:hypothetical protein
MKMFLDFIMNSEVNFYYLIRFNSLFFFSFSILVHILFISFFLLSKTNFELQK